MIFNLIGFTHTTSSIQIEIIRKNLIEDLKNLNFRMSLMSIMRPEQHVKFPSFEDKQFFAITSNTSAYIEA